MSVPGLPVAFMRDPEKRFDSKREGRRLKLAERRQEKAGLRAIGVTGGGGMGSARSSRTGGTNGSEFELALPDRELSESESSSSEESSSSSDSSSDSDGSRSYSSEESYGGSSARSGGSSARSSIFGSGSARSRSSIGSSTRGSSTARSQRTNGGSTARSSVFGGSTARTARSTRSGGSSTHRTGRTTSRTARSALLTARSHASNRSSRSRRSAASRSLDGEPVRGWGLYASWKRHAKHQAAKRRHPTLVYFEALDAIGNEEEELKMLEKDRARIRQRRQNLEQEVMQQRQNDFYERVRREDLARFETDVERRARDNQRCRIIMESLEQWGLEADKGKEATEATALEEDRKRRGDEALDRTKARKEGESQAKEADRYEDEKETQAILAMMRRAGVIAGVNAPAAEDEDLQRETAKHVVLRCKKPEDLVGVVRGRNFSLFTVDLRRFKNVESMKGDNVGIEGCIFLALMLRQGCCPRLTSLNLGWNRIKKVGADRLFDMFGKQGGTILIEHLDLRMNHIPGQCIKKLCRYFRGGNTLMFLKVLDLRQNMIGDEGALALAHCLVNGHLSNISRLYVNANQITDKGILALFRVFTGETIVCPQIECVNCRDNLTKVETIRNMTPCPIFFQV